MAGIQVHPQFIGQTTHISTLLCSFPLLVSVVCPGNMGGQLLDNGTHEQHLGNTNTLHNTPEG